MITPIHDKKLFLLDAFALIYRAYFAFAKNPRVNSKGQNTSAAFGFTNALIDVIKKEQPTHLAVVFDAPGGATNRQEDFAAYKANRQEMPEDLRAMIDPIKKIIEAFNIPILLKSGFEADDVIGTLAKVAEKEGYYTYMMTPDKDFGQLVSEKIFIYKPGRGGDPASVLGVNEVCEKFEVDHPLKVIDILGLWGDAADNIPGIPGIGEKTSKKLIQEYGSLENIIANADKLKGKMRENVIEFADQGRLSKQLATIILDVDVPFDPEHLIMCEPDAEKIKEVFTELEFRTLAKRVIGEEITVTAPVNEAGQFDLFGTQSLLEIQTPIETAELKTLVTEKPSYHLITNEEERTELLHLLLQQQVVCFDTETTSTDALNAELVGISFAYKAREAFYVAVPKDQNEAQIIVDFFKPFFENTSIEKIGHNIKYDLHILDNYGMKVAGPLFDTMIAHYLIQPESKLSMDFLAEYYLQYKPITIETLIGKKGKNQGNMRDLDPKEVSDYACEDADITFQLKEILEPQIQKEHLKELFYGMEMPLVSVLQRMEREGIAIDVPGLHEYSSRLEEESRQLEEEIKSISGEDFNLDSPKQLGEVLFEKMKITTKAKKTKTGQYQTSEDALEQYKNDHPIIGKILEYRQNKKLKGTYVDPLPLLLDKKDKRVHTNYMQTVAATGRLSSNNPNLQNIPIRTEKGREIRKAFISRGEGFKLMSADYSQIELRIIAALSEDPTMVEAFQKHQDIHAATAAKVFQVALEDVTKTQRSAAKAVNFGIMYGQSAFGLAQNLGISRTEAKTIIDSYFTQYNTIKSFMDGLVNNARELGYVETIKGRRRYLPDINSANAIVRGFAERNAINAPIQGSAADIIKLAMIVVDKAMQEQQVKSKLLLQVHDELVFDVHESEHELMKQLVREAMESAIDLVVPMEVEMKIADNWLDAH
ncbi:MAG: DNA polymerase I [Crocinitomicaceae bacterium]|nr:DNA polymerase I [Crocinitomicaceae bacterium]